MLTEKEILYALDNYRNGYDPAFVQLGHPYVYPIDSRINVFRNNQDKWALAIEVLGFNPRSGGIGLEITYYGNCLINLEYRESYHSNSYCVLPIEQESFDKTIEYENLKQDAEFWIVRGEKLKLTHSKDEYRNAGVDLKEFEPNEISAEEAGRLLVIKHRNLFRATNEELYKSVPKDLEKILVIDEWHHRDFYQDNFDPVESLPFPIPTPEQLREAFESQIDKFSKMNISKEIFLKSFYLNEYNGKRIDNNKVEWENNRPSSYETWQMIAKILVTGDIGFYNPKLEPTSHWRHWPDAGAM